MTGHCFFGRVISFSSGFHTDQLSSLLDSYRLLYLGATGEEATRMIIGLTKQHFYLKEFEELSLM